MLKRLFAPTCCACLQQCNILTAEVRVRDSMLMSRAAQKLLSQTAVLKLNGGLGTSMGLEKAKSLLEVRTLGSAADSAPPAA